MADTELKTFLIVLVSGKMFRVRAHNYSDIRSEFKLDNKKLDIHINPKEVALIADESLVELT